ncbi:hypothetical protein [Schlesneria paludicola]|uniref:hypothetical protein n=1 Tax=Schlesneria paludicola TaxID=360056 RepID=UPI00029AB67A|nr:hypothetical protein [Schlesneria paludicola]
MHQCEKCGSVVGDPKSPVEFHPYQTSLSEMKLADAILNTLFFWTTTEKKMRFQGALVRCLRQVNHNVKRAEGVSK